MAEQTTDTQVTPPAAAPVETKPADTAAAKTPSAQTPADNKPGEQKTLLSDSKADATDDVVDDKSAEESTKEEAKPVTEKYDLKAPEGFTMDEKLLGAVTPILKEIGVTNEQAQKIIDAYAPVVKAQIEAQQKEVEKHWEEQKSQWKAESEKILGNKVKSELAHAARFLNKFGSEAVRQLLDETGLGNHPELVKMLISAGKAISSDPFVDPNAKGPSKGMDAKVMYPTMKD